MKSVASLSILARTGKCIHIIKDLVGLVGEVGEFSGIAKKIGLKLDQPRYDGPTLAESRDSLG